tara:strand:- start:1820 stop:2599 length:780 start_codon:yes stop_codon:yes gene_type:complete
MVKYALCISGAVRSFPRSIFVESIKPLLNEIPNTDIFIVLKMTDKFKNLLNSSEGINSIIKNFQCLKPKKIIFIDSFLDENIDSSSYSSQLLLINKSIELACEYGNYDFFIRYRPDFILLNLNLHFENLNENIIYTTRKYDALASDQVIMFSNKLRKIWWNNLNFLLTEKRCPEYEIFNKLPEKVSLQNGPCFYGGLLRNQHVKLKFWDICSEMKYQDKYNLEISKDTNFENKYRDMLLEYLNSYNFDFLYIDKLHVNS